MTPVRKATSPASKARAVAVFTVEARGIRLRVRVLPSIEAVAEAYHGGARRDDRCRVHAFFQSASRAPLVGTITLPADGRLDELVPHETVHAVLHACGEVRCHDDEEFALSVGLLSAKIFLGLRRRGVLLGVAP